MKTAVRSHSTASARTQHTAPSSVSLFLFGFIYFPHDPGTRTMGISTTTTPPWSTAPGSIRCTPSFSICCTSSGISCHSQNGKRCVIWHTDVATDFISPHQPLSGPAARSQTSVSLCRVGTSQCSGMRIPPQTRMVFVSTGFWKTVGNACKKARN